MALASYWTNLTDLFGNVLPNGEVEVRDTGGTLADLFEDDAGVTPASNPISPDDNGLVEFYIAAGTYDLTYSIGAATSETVRETIVDQDVVALRSDLASTDAGKGAELVARMQADSVFALCNLAKPTTDGYGIELRAFYSDTDTGGGRFYWDADRSKADANGGTIIDPDTIGTLSATALGTFLTQQGTGSGTGCWVRLFTGHTDIEWFGAKSGTDSTAAIQAAIDYVSGQSDSYVYIPSGTYTTSAQLDVPILTSIIGANRNTSIIDGASGTHNILSLESTGSSKLAFNTLSDFRINANATGDGIRLDFYSYVNIERVFVRGGKNNIRLITSCFNNAIRDCLIAHAADYGVYFDESGANVNVNNIENCQFDGNSKVHIYVAAANSYGNLIESNNFNAGGVSIWGTAGSYQNSVIANAFEDGSSSYHVNITFEKFDLTTTSSPVEWYVERNQFTNSGTKQYHARLRSGGRHSVVRNTFKGSPSAAYIRLNFTSTSLVDDNSFNDNNTPLVSVNGTDNLVLRSKFQSEVLTFADGDGTPSVLPDQGTGVKNSEKLFKTGNTSATTLTRFDNGMAGQEIRVVFGDANTTVDFTGTTLKGNAGVDWSPAQNDHMTCAYDGTNWYCDISDNTA